MAEVVITSASFQGFDQRHDWEEQPAIIHRLTEADFPLRNALTPHAQSKIPKCFGWDMYPGHDFYIWIDASYQLFKGATEFLLKELGDNDILVFPHPFNKTIKDEYEFLKKNLPHSAYLQRRYKNELLEDLYALLDPTDPVYHAAIFIYRNTKEVQCALKEWWYYSSRYHLDDQLSFTKILEGLKVKVMPQKIEDYHYWKYWRHCE